MLETLLRTKLNNHSKDVDSIYFDATQNARIVANAEQYYHSMIQGNEQSWNIRDHHMMETLDTLLTHYGPNSKAIVWEHNTHIGDYRATDMELLGQVNIGGLSRIKYGNEAVALVGFSTYQGNVSAASAWDTSANDAETTMI